ncbi:unnamed protein product [Sphenostylis stenocarpa]|uniref:Uncharacterized protein n=1 Tax=Sphenostylis stenocarpa TaxID=92480 RepID=A0AA86SPX6_9FABA|nr:unnamed protein product [Sphenostylis stenocarpa]
MQYTYFILCKQFKSTIQISPFPSSQTTKLFFNSYQTHLLLPSPFHFQPLSLSLSLSSTASFRSKETASMDSSYFGKPNFGNERSSASSSRKGKKNNNSDKPKQPQRGLGVAQLEKIRLHSQMACSYHPSLHGSYPSNFTNVNLYFLLL